MSTFRTLLRAAVVALPLGLAGAAVARAQTANYDFYVAGFKVGTMTFTPETGARDYSAQARISAAGIVGAFLTFDYAASSSGALGKAGPVPRLFQAVSDSPSGRRTTRIDWKNGVPVKVTVEPPREDEPDPREQAGTVDPVAAGVAVLSDGPAERMCATTVDIFDGSRRSRLTVGPRRAVKGGFTCAGTYARLKGEPHTLSSQREFPFTLTFSEGADGMAKVRRIETKTSFGTAAMERRS
ncbi:DUF3108 domain-containing protein [Amaricoccus solimangrovi]|uniref:DUF3108 domain-containing protein n=1 Tax=Amaricoccus solimangrovi TaxID=2589815 RepID=A0A501WHP4_9RHOB|nr:DUF3108 domain-containing protein [Amaricoccus solimangrovi]TPE47955.1 DUF3108 domain-containing protein [Amaricoccus solimangrovi]